MVSFRGQKKLGQRPDRSPSRVKFEISDEHPHPFICGVQLPGTWAARMAAQDRKTSGADDVMVYNNIVVLILENLETDHEKKKRLKEKIIVLQFT